MDGYTVGLMTSVDISLKMLELTKRMTTQDMDTFIKEFNKALREYLDYVDTHAEPDWMKN